MNNFRKIGVLGGIGPVATAHFYKTLLSIAQDKFGCVQDNEFPHIFIDSIPFQGSSKNGLDDKKLALKQLKTSLHILENAGVEIIAIPCISAHVFIDELRKESKVPIVSIVEEIVKRVKTDRINSVAVLSSMSTSKDNFFHKVLQQSNITCHKLNDETLTLISDVILEVMGGYNLQKSKNKLISKIEKLDIDKVDAAILGCTELPLAIQQKDSKMKLYDSITILAESVLDAAFLQSISSAMYIENPQTVSFFAKNARVKTNKINSKADASNKALLAY